MQKAAGTNAFRLFSQRAPAGAAGETGMRFEGETREQLKNGATLLLHRAPALNTVSFTLVLPFAPAEPAGLYHYIEHLFFERAGELRAKEINAAMTANGSEINGFTAQNYMCFSFTCRRAVFQSQLSLLYAMLSQREYGEEEMERVLPVIRNEMFEDNFYDVRSGDVIRSLWFDKRYNQSVLGDMRDLEEATDEDLDSCRRMLFNKGMCAFLAGGFAEEDAALVRGTFGQMPLQPFRVPPPQERLHDETPVNRRGRGRELQALVTYHVTDADRELKLAAHWLRSGLFDGLDAPVFAFFEEWGFKFYSVEADFAIRGDELVFSYLAYIQKKEKSLFEVLVSRFEKTGEKADFVGLSRPYLYDDLLLLPDSPERLCSHYMEVWADLGEPVTLTEEAAFAEGLTNEKLAALWRRVASSLRRIFYIAK